VAVNVGLTSGKPPQQSPTVLFSHTASDRVVHRKDVIKPARVSPMPDLVFSGKYIVQEVLAKGGMGVIYKAMDRALNRVVAIKVLHQRFSDDSLFTERFLREARAMARLDHDNIITIHAVEEERSTPYIVMEYFPSLNLRASIQDRKPNHLRTSIQIALQVAQALAYAHDQGIVHRNIKPANILVNDRGRVKLTDFGIAAARDEGSIVGHVVGTHEYMSPEQSGGGKIDGRADLYSVGVVLYEMVVGHLPLRHQPKGAIPSRMSGPNSDIALDFPGTVPSIVKGIIEDLLRRVLDHRTATAGLLVSQLQECLEVLPLRPEVNEESHTLVMKHCRNTRDEEDTGSPTSFAPPDRPSPASLPCATEPYYLLGQKDAYQHRPGSSEQQQPDTLSKRGTPTKCLETPKSLWGHYNMLPLLAVLIIAIVLMGFTLFLHYTDWSSSQRPMSGPHVDTSFRGGSEFDKAIQERGEKKNVLAPASQFPRRPSIGTTSITSSQQELETLLHDFRTAYEKQDLATLEQLSYITQDRQTFLNMMAGNYSFIRASIQDVSITTDEATATLIHEELVDKDGQHIAPNKMLRKIRITIRKDGDRWSKVVW
jgi:serine/threonine-protein kinase